MAEKRITEMTELTSADAADLFHIIDDVAGTPTNKKILASNLFNDLTRTPAEISAGVTPTSYLYNECDVRRYGAVVDGVTDDVAAINNAILVASQSGGEACMPSGTLLISSGSIIMKSNVKLFGQGWSTTVKLGDNSVANLNVATGVPAMIYIPSASDFVIRDFVIDGNDANNNATLFAGIIPSTCTSFRIYDMHVHDCYGSAIMFLTCDEFHVGTLYLQEITGAAGNPGEGLYIRKSNQWTVSNVLGKDLDDHLVYISGITATRSTDGVLNNLVGLNCGRVTGSSAFNALDGVSRIEWNNCHAYDCAKGFTMVGTNDAVQDITYNNCTAYNCDDATSPSGFSSSSSSGTTHKRIRFIGCKSYKSGVGTAAAVGYGFNLQDIDDLALENCEALDSNRDGLYLQDITKLRIIGGSYRNSGQETGITNRSGMRLGDVGNIADAFISMPDCSDNQEWGINIGVNCTNMVVHGGYYDGNGTGAYVKNTLTASSVKIIDLPEETTTAVTSRILGSAAPTNRAWAVGDSVINIAPAAGEPSGWICTVAGTPGTWIPYGGIQSANAYTMNATKVIDRTLLASASATTLNNNNVLAGLITDLQSSGVLQ